MEMDLKSENSINESQKEIHVADNNCEANSPEDDAPQSRFVFVKVIVNVKVHKVNDPEMVKTGRQK